MSKKNTSKYAARVIHHGRLLEIVAKCNLVGDVMHASVRQPAGGTDRCQFNLWTTYFRAGQPAVQAAEIGQPATAHEHLSIIYISNYDDATLASVRT